MMFRPRSGLILLLAVGLLPGCTNLLAKKAIERFAESMQEQDLERLKATTSDSFNEKALRQPEAVKDLKLLRVPDGKVEIESIEKLPDGTHKAIVKVGEKERVKQLEYRLSRDSRTRRWVVDDVILSQDSGRGDPVHRSVSEQMDLLLTCREFLITWKDGNREEQLGYCDDALRSELEQLPPKWFVRLSNDIVGSGRQRSFRPEARMNGERAVVVVPHPDGSLFLEMKSTDEGWRVRDLAIEPTSENSTGIRSLSKMTRALNRSARFLTAYAAENRDNLQATASQKFYQQCLAAADLDSVSIPVPALLAAEYQAKHFPDRIELLLKTDGQTYMLTLRNEEQGLDDGTKGLSEPRIDEVTLFGRDGDQVQRLSSMFLAHSVVNVFIDSLRDRDLKQLQKISSADFNERVWSRSYGRHFGILPFPDLDKGEPDVISTVFHGDVTEVTVVVGETPMTLTLHMARGWMVVDEVVIPAHNRPVSLKQNLELLLPVYAFAAAAHRGDLPGLIRESSDGLDRTVWLQVSQVPPLAKQLVRPLMSEVLSIAPEDSWTTIRTSDGTTATEIRLTREGTRHVVHDITLISESNAQNRMEFMAAMRQSIAESQLNSRMHRREEIQQASATVPAETAAPVQSENVREKPLRTSFDPISPAVYTR